MRIIFLHTVLGVTDLFTGLIRRHLPAETDVLHIVDETIIAAVRAAGGPTPDVERRLIEHAQAAASGAAALQLTCSTVSPCAVAVGAAVPIPVFTIDGPMAGQAVRRYRRLGVLATNRATLTPTLRTLREAARSARRTLSLKACECDAAYRAFLKGDRATHDRIVLGEAARLARGVDAVVLAQASMARLAPDLKSLPVPVLTTPLPAMRHLARFIMRAG
jgi:aspartate/glutamate racemase